jgi:hypothetical protein
MFAVATMLVAAPTLAADAHPNDSGDTRPIAADISVNVLGPLQFGLTSAVEVGSSHLAGFGRFRWLNSGRLADNTLPTKGTDEHLAFSYGVGLGARYFSAPGAALTGFNVGLVLEYLHVHNEDTKTERTAFITSLIIPQLEGGYRWRFGRFLVGAGAGVGYAVVTSKSTEDLSGGTNAVVYANNAENKPYASAALDLGFFF